MADGDASARAELARVFGAAGFRVVEAATGEEALRLARQYLPTLVVLEVALGSISGYEVCRALREELGEDLLIVFLSGIRTESYDRVAGLLVGADDYVVKPYAVDELLARVRRLVDRARPAPASLSQLTPRELEVLRLLAEGYSAKDIAGRLFISAKTVGTHIEHIRRKLGVRTRVQAVALAFREGLAAREPGVAATGGRGVGGVSLAGAELRPAEGPSG
ncbi:MAG TPA: response regulator transcription factor [Gaiellaceae bacterium]|nr:response regulator transcription factor [Gaiellaceae bacterium]